MEQMKQKSPKKSLTKRQKDFLEIFKNKMCMVTHACKASNVSRARYYRWLEQESFREGVDEVKESVKDFGELALHKLIKDGNVAAIIFYNKCKNKDRGYVEKSEISQEVEHKGEPLKIIIEEKVPDGDKPST